MGIFDPIERKKAGEASNLNAEKIRQAIEGERPVKRGSEIQRKPKEPEKPSTQRRSKD